MKVSSLFLYSFPSWSWFNRDYILAHGHSQVLKWSSRISLMQVDATQLPARLKNFYPFLLHQINTILATCDLPAMFLSCLSNSSQGLWEGGIGLTFTHMILSISRQGTLPLWHLSMRDRSGSPKCDLMCSCACHLNGCTSNNDRTLPFPSINSYTTEHENASNACVKKKNDALIPIKLIASFIRVHHFRLTVDWLHQCPSLTPWRFLKWCT